MAILKILDFSAGSKFAIKLSQDMTEKFKTVIEFGDSDVGDIVMLVTL